MIEVGEDEIVVKFSIDGDAYYLIKGADNIQVMHKNKLMQFEDVEELERKLNVYQRILRYVKDGK